jgi:hypothetical protein
MKNKIIRLFSVLLFVSCGNNTNKATATGMQEDIPATKDTWLMAKVDGSTWQASHDIQSYTMDNIIMLGGENDYWVMGLNIPAAAAAGQTLVVNASIAKKEKTKSNVLFNADAATVKITAKTAASMEGTFSFTAVHTNGRESIKVENGTFKTKLATR